MTATAAITFAFIAAVVLAYGTQLWLARRQFRHVAAHRDAVPTAFADRITPEAHRRAADYTIAKLRLGTIDTLLGWIIAIGMTLLGGLQVIAVLAQSMFGDGLVAQLAVFAGVGLVSGLLHLPLSWYGTFRVEQAFGFNRMTLPLWFADLAKGVAVGVIVGAPLAAAFLALMEQAGAFWWLWAWALWIGFQVLAMWAFPTLIAPLFNKFSPLTDDALRVRVEGLLARVGFRSRGLFVMDGSRRSSHGNAYFSGLGSAKRIVFFDTLLERLEGDEVEAVLAHELGHFKLRHITKRLVVAFVVGLAVFALLGLLSNLVAFHVGLGYRPLLTPLDHAATLVLFAFALPPFTFFLGPLSSRASRRHEFEADAFAASQADGRALVRALVKLYEDNASTLTPDPVYSAFYYSHPPAERRIARLQGA
ncbi:M48 family metallopeptidase [soil metagenome]